MVQFSKEPNNLYNNVNSFKHSGLANAKTVSVQAGKDSRRRNSVEAYQVAENFYRRDLKSAALARLSSVHRSLKVAKSGVKKMNRQTSKKSNRV
ncbi:hypothetical protein MKW98_030792 [Papaver atlanticum]|uniref:Ribosomal L28e/Mak16 domain-containing protein n=1 Tax=Papaver atlanticum TaxID=357466 RepID=A0AAD4X713_9MAGN|nr:hypothetical protein MKW98_030792 [Papaver atlanticum]